MVNISTQRESWWKCISFQFKHSEASFWNNFAWVKKNKLENKLIDWTFTFSLSLFALKLTMKVNMFSRQSTFISVLFTLNYNFLRFMLFFLSDSQHVIQSSGFIYLFYPFAFKMQHKTVNNEFNRIYILYKYIFPW